MALDRTAAAVGLGQLQALPFKNIIGGPLTAAIQAQALAADTTVRFVRDIGFETVNGRLHAVNLEFTYEDATGYFRRVTVPVLSVVPIPFIVIDTVNIQFKARISASAEQASSSSSEQNESASVTGGFRFAGQSINITGSYSSKKDSKASQDSKYSIEYTMDVQVEASQAGMPQGMTQILNILQDGVSNRPHTNQITLFSLSPLLTGDAAGNTFDDTSFKLFIVDANGEAVTSNVTATLKSASDLIAQDGSLDSSAASSGIYGLKFKPGTKYNALTPSDATETLQIEVTIGATPDTEVTTLSRAVTVRKPS